MTTGSLSFSTMQQVTYLAEKLKLKVQHQGSWGRCDQCKSHTSHSNVKQWTLDTQQQMPSSQSGFKALMCQLLVEATS